MTTSEEQLVPRIYVASLADYNAGRLHGRWIDATQPAEEIHAQIQEMLAESNEPVAEEWAIHAHEGFEGLGLGEFESIEYVAEVAALIGEHGPMFASLVAYLGELSDARRYMEDGYRGSFDKVEDYVQDLVEDCYSDALNQLPDFIRYHIDYEGVARDFELSGDIFTIECQGRVHVFDAHI